MDETVKRILSMCCFLLYVIKVGQFTAACCDCAQFKFNEKIWFDFKKLCDFFNYVSSVARPHILCARLLGFIY